MKTLHALLLSLGVTALGIAAPAPASATVVDQQFTTTGPVDSNTATGVTFAAMAQTFTVGVTGLLAAVELYVLRTGGTTGDLTVDIRGLVSGGAPEPLAANALGSTTLANADVPVRPSTTPYGFAPILIDLTAANIAVTAGQILAIGVSSAAGEFFVFQTDYSNGYAGGGLWTQSSDGLAFSPTTSDFSFTTYVNTGTSVPEPGTLGLLVVGLTGLGWAHRRRGRAARA
ncbi:MAG: PEP-CTERM sorting domain-containing protein [Hyphomicrobiales bacterium]|nr:PEP-CTERM sorting domain-containing protein [Hyphomicrobiales bacterium]